MPDAVLHLERLRKSFGALVVTDDLTFDVMPRELHAVIGPNGAGKTTLINQISGLVAPDSGTILFAGRDITALPTHARAELGLARSFQVSSILPGFSVLENVALAVQSRAGSSFRVLGRAAAEAALNDPAMAALADVGLAERAHVPAGELAHGEKRALELAIALAMQPKVLLLDEPMADICLRVGAGEVVTLLGRNGMGKTTTIRTLMGLLPACGGSAAFEGVSLIGLPPYRIAQAGLGLVPEGRQIFPTLSVEENLIATAASRLAVTRWTLERVYDFFPQLAERRRHMGNELSGGEQQMLAIGRALMTNPKLLILDEATEGLAPLLRLEIWKCLARLKSEGQAILLVDKHLAALLKLADRHAIIEKGQVVWSGTSAALAADPTITQRYLQV